MDYYCFKQTSSCLLVPLVSHHSQHSCFMRCVRWDTMIFLVGFGTAMEVVGYIFRCLSSQIDPYA